MADLVVWGNECGGAGEVHSLKALPLQRVTIQRKVSFAYPDVGRVHTKRERWRVIEVV